MKARLLLLSSLLAAGLSLAQPMPPGPPRPPGPPIPPAPPPALPMPPGESGFPRAGLPGIPPHVAQKLGIPPETVKKVRDLSFDSNGQLIQLEADLKRAQLELERALSETAVDEGQVMGKLEAVSKAELAVRKNRTSLMVRIRKLLGNDTWEKLQGELHGPGADRLMLIGPPPGRVTREVRVFRDGREETVDVRGD